MNIRPFLVITILLWSLAAFAQALTFEECGRNGGACHGLATGNNHNIDISSRVEVSVSLNGIIQEIRTTSSTTRTDSLISEIEHLGDILGKAWPQIKKLEADIAKLDPSAADYGSKFNLAQANLAGTTTELLSSISYPGNVLWQRIEIALPDDPFDGVNIYMVIFKETERYINELRDELKKALIAEGVQIQMTSTLYNSKGSTNLPLPGFNTVSAPDRYNPYAFDLALLNAQISSIQAIEQQAKTINTDGLGNVVANQVQEWLTYMENTLKVKLQEKLLELENLKLGSVELVKSAESERFVADLKGLIDEIKKLKAIVEALAVKYKAPQSATSQQLLTGMYADVENVLKSIHAIKVRVADINAFVINTLPTLAPTVKNDLAKLQTWAGETFVNEIIAPVQNFLLQTGIKRTANGLANFTDEVLTHALNTLPSSTTLDFQDAGFREHGDYAVLEMRVVKPDGATQTINKTNFNLMKTGGYVDVQATLSFVSHFEDGSFNTKFIAAPSISIIYKFPTLKARYAYRKFVDLGLGLNIATLNFNKESAMEIGIGVVLAGLNVHDNWRNLLTAGFGYNLMAGKPYAIIGLNLPFLGFSTK